MNTWKQNLEETKQHYINWWNHKGIVLNMWEHFQQGVTPHADIPEPRPYKDLNQRWFDPEWRAEYLDWYVAHSSLKADILPVANTQLGPGSLAAILGGVFEGGEDTIWIHPNPNYTDDIVFDPQHPNWLLHKELLRACKEKAQGHYYVGMPDLMEGLDVLAALKGTDQVLLDTVMYPERLEHQMQQINDIYFQVFDELYIREQCQRIDYTLYHLDGVGAIHHLDALLEIQELNAIQWTPGVGEPQGGSPKWYDLYKKILASGKSIMACWVTLDELRPLLDNIGGDGIHVEMDFHNEQEVEQALHIIEEYEHSRNLHPADVKDDADREVEEIIRKIENPQNKESLQLSLRPASLMTSSTDRILVLDGAMGTMIQQYQLREEDFRSVRFAKHNYDLKGCNDVLSLTAPFVVRDIHRKYLKAGADIIETNTFNAQRISMGDFGLQDYCREINLAAVQIARQCAEDYSTPEKPRYVAGSIGPTSRTTSVATSGEPLSESILREAYAEQILALVDGGVDVLLIETIFDTQNARIAFEEAKRIAPTLPIMLSFSVSTPDGHNMLGQDILEFIKTFKKGELFSVGINCVSDVKAMTPLVCQLARFGTKVSIYPNAGMPDGKGRYNKTPESLVADLWPLLENHCLNIVGGCCGTTDNHINLIGKAIEPVPGIFISPLTADAEQHTYTNLHGGLDEGRIINGSEKQLQQNDSPGERLFQAIMNGKSDEAASATKEAIALKIVPQDLINGQMIRAMSEVGQRFQDGKAFVPQLLMAGRAMKAALELLKPMMAGAASTSLGKVVIGTVKGDLHDIGKNLVASMLEGCGFEVVNIGIDVSADTFIQAVKENQPDILCMSALLTTTMGYMKEVIDALEAAGIRNQVKVMVGGAPVTQGFADEIGADGYSDNANSAVTVAKQLLGRL